MSTTADIAANAGACGNSGITTAPSPLSLREATCLANNNGGHAVTITVPAGTYVLTNGELGLGLVPGSSISLVGAGAGSTVISGNNASRVLDLDKNLTGGVTTSISGVTITGGADSTFGGAGIIGGSNNNTTADRLTLVGRDRDRQRGQRRGTRRHEQARRRHPVPRRHAEHQQLHHQQQLSAVQLRFRSRLRRQRHRAGLGREPDHHQHHVLRQQHGQLAVATPARPTVARWRCSVPPRPSFSITNSRFLNNTATSTAGSGPAVGAAIWEQSGNLEA